MSETSLTEEVNPDELGRLRDILFGSQSRTFEKRLGDLEAGLRTARQELTDQLNEKLNALADSNASQLAEVRREFGEKLEKQSTDQSSQLRAAQKELSERLDRQSTEQASQLSAVQKQLSDSIKKTGRRFFASTTGITQGIERSHGQGICRAGRTDANIADRNPSA